MTIKIFQYIKKVTVKRFSVHLKQNYVFAYSEKGFGALKNFICSLQLVIVNLKLLLSLLIVMFL